MVTSETSASECEQVKQVVQIIFRHTSQKKSDLHTYNTRSKNEPHFQLFSIYYLFGATFYKI